MPDEKGTLGSSKHRWKNIILYHKQDGRTCSGFMWFRTGSGGRILTIRRLMPRILQNVENLTSWSIISWSSTLIYEARNTMTKHIRNIKSCPTSQHCHLAIICWIYSTVHRNAITNTPSVTKIHLFNVVAIAYILFMQGSPPGWSAMPR